MAPAASRHLAESREGRTRECRSRRRHRFGRTRTAGRRVCGGRGSTAPCRAATPSARRPPAPGIARSRPRRRTDRARSGCGRRRPSRAACRPESAARVRSRTHDLRPLVPSLPADGRDRSRPWPAAPAPDRPGERTRRRCATRRACRRRRRGERRPLRLCGAPRSCASSDRRFAARADAAARGAGRPGSARRCSTSDRSRRGPRPRAARRGRSGRCSPQATPAGRRETRRAARPGAMRRRQSQARRELDGASVARVGPEVVPVRVGRLVGIAFVADRWRHQAEIGGALAARGWRRCARSPAATPCARSPRPRAATAPGPSSRRRCSARARWRRTRIRRRCRSRARDRHRARWRSRAPCRS